MKNLLILLSVFFIVPNLFSQGISINNSNTPPHASAMLDVSSSNKGVLIPRMTMSQRDAISPLTVGLMVYQTDQSPGFYCYNGSSWLPIAADILAINDLVDGISDGSSVFLGKDSGINDDGVNSNVGVGIESLKSNTSGNNNTAVGYWSLRNNSSGWRNNAFGQQALRDNTSGSDNIAIGTSALRINNGNKNIALGHETMNFNTTGIENIAIGYQALRSNVGGNYNNAFGAQALYANTASGNTAVGHFALHFNSTGTGNVGLGYNVNYHNQTGSNNTIIGYEAGRASSLHNKSHNIFLGYQAGYNETGSNKLYIENSNSSTPLIGGDFSIDELYLNGKVGINTVSPLTQLQVDGNITFAPAGLTTNESRFIGQSIKSQINFEASNGFGGMEVENIDRPSDDDSAQQLHFWTHHQGIESARRMTIDTVGFVGIGTESPGNILETARDGGVSSIISTTYRPSGFGAGSFIGRAARGSKDSPSAVQYGDYLASFSAIGYGSTGFSSRPRGRLAFTAAQNWTDGEHGSNMILMTVPLNTNSEQERMRISSQGNVGIGTVNLPDPQHKLHIVQDSSGGQGLKVTQNSDWNAATIDIPNTSSTAHALNIYNSGSGYGLDVVIQPTGTGHGGRFTIDNPNNDQPAIYGEHNGTGHVAEFLVLNSDHSSPALYVQHNGKGNVGQFLANNNTNTNSALYVSTQGTGTGGEFQINNILSNSPAINANTIGTGSAGIFTISNTTNAFSSVYSNTSGIGNAGRFQISNPASGAVALFAKSNGTGPALGGNSNGDGIAGFLNVLNNTNANNALEVKTLGLGSAALFKVDNTLSTDTVVLIEGNGSGPSIVADGTIDMAGFKMPTSPTLGHVLTSDGTGIGTWQAPSFDFSNGGDAGGSNRSLGNTDNYALSFLTNNTERIKIFNDGGIRLDGNLGIFTDPKTPGINKAIDLYDSETFSNPYLKISGHNSAYINLESRRTGTTNGKSWWIRSGSGSVLDLDKFFIYNSTDAIQAFTIRGGGNVGIGINDPLEKLHVNGNLRINGYLADKDGDAGTSGQILSSTGTGTDWVSSTSIVDYKDGGEAAGANRTLGNTDGFNLGFLTNNLPRLNITNDGKIGRKSLWFIH